MKLYYAQGACSLSPHIALREAGMNVDLVKVDTKTKALAGGGDFWQVNSKGYVPTLELDDGQRLTEGPAIVQYIADKAPAAKLAPANGTMDRYRLQEWLNFVTSELHKQFGPMFNPATPAEMKEQLKTKIAGRFDWLEKQMQGKDYLMGSQFSVADAYLFTVLRWTGYVGMDLAKWPTLTAYVARVNARPGVQAALKAEGLA